MLRFLLVLGFLAPLVSYGQPWELRHQYPRFQPAGPQTALAPDSLLRYYQPGDDPGVREVIRKSDEFGPNPEQVELQKGDKIWLKLEVVNGEAGDARYLVEVDPDYLDWSIVDIFEVAGDSVLRTIHTGNELPAAAKPIRNARNLFWLDLRAEEQKTLYFRLESENAIERSALSVRILDPQSLYDFEGLVFRQYTNSYNYRRLPDVRNIPSVRVHHSLEFFIDTSGTLTFEALKKDWDQKAHFLRDQDRSLADHEVSWCRFTLINSDSTARSHLINTGGYHPVVDIYLPQADGSYRPVRTGKNVPIDEKAVPHPLNLFSYTIAPLDTVSIFLRYQPIPGDWHVQPTVFFTGLSLYEPNSLMNKTRKAGLLKGFYLGIFIFQLFYFLLRSYLEKNKQDFYYALIVLGALLVFIVQDNLRGTFLASQILLYQGHILLSISLPLIVLGLYLFTNRYLDVRANFPRIYQLQTLLLIIVTGSGMGYYLGNVIHFQNEQILYFLVDSSFLIAGAAFHITLFLYAVLAIVAYLRKVPYAGSYLIAFSPFLLGSVIAAWGYRIYHADFWPDLRYWGFLLSSVLFAIVGARRHKEMKIKEVKAESLIALDKAKTEFYSNITHEFRTPLTVIMGLADTLPGNSREKEMIKKNSREVLHLVQQLLDISKAQSGHLQLKLIEDNVLPYLEYLIESFHTLAEQKNIDLRFTSEQDEIIMSFDREKLKFILNNLVANAIKFTPTGGKVLITARREQHQLLLKVRDTGIGLSSEDLDRIFDRFYQAPKNGVTNRQGDGIGLALTKDLVDLMQGRIEVESSPGQGTAFTVSLPVEPGSISSKDFISKEPPGHPLIPQFTENEFVVLVVDDSVDVIYYLERILTPKYKVVKAYNGREGWEMAVHLIPDIIISDVVMPELDGYQLTEKLKEDPRTNHIPVILLTARSTQEDKVQGLRGGADAYLTKPFHEEELQVRINKLIENRRKLQEAFAKNRFIRPSAQRLDPFVANVLDILEKNYQDDTFGVQELVNALHLSRMQVHRKLKALTDLSTSRFLNYFRLEKGKAMLSDRQFNISEVAYSCGFADPDYFSKLFTKVYGQSPQAYRNSIVA